MDQDRKTTSSEPKIVPGALLVKLTIRGWHSSVRDRDAEKIVVEKTGCDPKKIRCGKKLADREFIAPMASLISQCRAEHYRMTAPWDDRGYRILGAANYTGYRASMDGYKQRIQAALYEQLKHYHEQRIKEKVSLGTLFKEEDYPTREALEAQYSFDLDVTPLPDGKDIRLNIRKDELDRVRKEYAARTREKLESAMNDTWNRVYTAVSHLVARLEAKDQDRSSPFYESVVENLAVLAGLLPGLNVTDDTDMTRLTREIQDKLVKYDAEALKGSPLLRREVKESAQRILSDLDHRNGGSHGERAVDQTGSSISGLPVGPEQAGRSQESDYIERRLSGLFNLQAHRQAESCHS
jgi:hypothetical protein